MGGRPTRGSRGRRAGRPGGPTRRGDRRLLVGAALLLVGSLAWIGLDAMRADSPSADRAVQSSAPRVPATRVAPTTSDGADGTNGADDTGSATTPVPGSTDSTSGGDRDGAGGPSDGNPAPRAAGLGVLAGHTIGIDPGHAGGNAAHATEIGRLVDAGTLRKACDTTGTQTPGGYTEAAYNLDVARRLAALLDDAGATTVMTRTTDDGWGPCIDERARITSRAEIAVSVHADGNLAAGARGFHVIVPASVPGLTDDIAVDSRRLGDRIADALESGTSIPRSNYLGVDGIDVRDDIGGINLSTVPKVLVETGNMKSAADRRQLESAAGRQRIAAAIAAGLAAFVSER